MTATDGAGARATVHGAVSIVNAIAAGKGATLGTEQQVRATVEVGTGRGVVLESDGRQNISSRLVYRTVEEAVPRRVLDKNRIRVRIDSDIPAGYGLKSSSAISSAVALACTGAFRSRVDDQRVLVAGVEASMRAKVSMTGAYDDACACYYGGFNVTDNLRRRLVVHRAGPRGMAVVIFVPRARRRGNVKRLGNLGTVFEKAWGMAREGDYWNAMILNGLAAVEVLGSEPGLVADLVEKGAVGASISGNGPAVAAVVRMRDVTGVKKVFARMEGRVIETRVNNKKAEVHKL